MKRWPLSIIGPGILVAATGVGAGDLATAALVGNRLGTTVLWLVVVGAAFKYVLNEGLTRWQLATGETLLDGAMTHLGAPVRWAFLAYFLVWSFLVAAALMSASGIAAHALLPVADEASTGKVLWGIGHGLVGLLLVRLGGYRLFERIMAAFIGIMFVAVLATAVVVGPDLGTVAGALLLPSLPAATADLGWAIALMGGVGGTLTVLCYGYWIRERGRFGAEHLTDCRIDLGAGYVATALFGLAMVVIGAAVPEITGGGASLLVDLGTLLRATLGATVGTLFLIGAWGAIFSSLLGVWQSVPYLFADLYDLLVEGPASNRRVVTTEDPAYRHFGVALAVVPMIGLGVGFARMQWLYAFVGALFMPMLALALLILNGRVDLVGEAHRDRPATRAALVVILLFFLWAGWLAVR